MGKLVALAFGGYQLAENSLSLLEIWQIYLNFDVEPACSQNGVVYQINAIGGGDNDYPIGGRESVHLAEKLVDC